MDNGNLPAVRQENALVFFEQAKFAIGKCFSIDEVKEIRDRAEALRMYHRQASDSFEMQNQCAEIKVRAERRAGELLKEMQKAKAGRPPENRSHDATNFRGAATLADLGINKSQSSRWQAIAEIPEEIFDEFIETTKAAGRELTTKSVQRIAKEEKVKASTNAFRETPTNHESGVVGDLASLTAKFRCIYADPPWKYGNQATRAATNNHYPTMTVEEIAALPIPEIVDEQALLFLWVTNGFLFESKEIIDAWGFEFKSSMVWVKDQMGIGNYVRNAHEMLLICSRGGLRSNGKSQKSWIQEPRTKHSKKPESFRKIVEAMAEGPRIELFARQSHPGWVSWGNQIEKNLFSK